MAKRASVSALLSKSKGSEGKGSESSSVRTLIAPNLSIVSAVYDPKSHKGKPPVLKLSSGSDTPTFPIPDGGYKAPTIHLHDPKGRTLAWWAGYDERLPRVVEILRDPDAPTVDWESLVALHYGLATMIPTADRPAAFMEHGRKMVTAGVRLSIDTVLPAADAWRTSDPDPWIDMLP